MIFKSIVACVLLSLQSTKIRVVLVPSLKKIKGT